MCFRTVVLLRLARSSDHPGDAMHVFWLILCDALQTSCYTTVCRAIVEWTIWYHRTIFPVTFLLADVKKKKCAAFNSE